MYTGTLVWGAEAKDKAEPVRVEKAFPAIICKAQFRRVNRKLHSRAPRQSHPRRIGSSYLLSGLIKCKVCNRALSSQDAKSGKFAYYVCQSVMKRGSGACDAPRLNARRFEELVVGKIRENVLTESNIRALVKLVDEEMDGIAKEQRQKLETIEAELVDVKRRLGRLYDLAETTDLDMDDFKPRIRDHRERQERLEATGEEARTMLSQRREVLDDLGTITAYALDLSMFLNESELTERRAFTGAVNTSSCSLVGSYSVRAAWVLVGSLESITSSDRGGVFINSLRDLHRGSAFRFFNLRFRCICAGAATHLSRWTARVDLQLVRH